MLRRFSSGAEIVLALQRKADDLRALRNLKVRLGVGLDLVDDAPDQLVQLKSVNRERSGKPSSKRARLPAPRQFALAAASSLNRTASAGARWGTSRSAAARSVLLA